MHNLLVAKMVEPQESEKGRMKMTIAEIMNDIHQQGIENEVFELLTQWMIEDRYNKMKKLGESEATIRAIYKLASQNKNLKQAINGIIILSGSED